MMQGREQNKRQRKRKKCTGLDTGELLSVPSGGKKRTKPTRVETTDNMMKKKRITKSGAQL